MQEQGAFVDHSSINWWAIRFLPLLEKVFRKHKRPVLESADRLVHNLYFLINATEPHIIASDRSNTFNNSAVGFSRASRSAARIESDRAKFILFFSKLGVQAQAQNIDRSTIRVISGVGDTLVIECGPQPLLQLQAVVRFDDFFRAIIKFAISEEVT